MKERLFAENYKTLRKEIKEGLGKWKDSSCSWIGRLTLLDVNTTQSSLHNHHNPYQNPNCLFHRNGEGDPQIYVKLQGTLNSQS